MNWPQTDVLILVFIIRTSFGENVPGRFRVAGFLLLLIIIINDVTSTEFPKSDWMLLFFYLMLLKQNWCSFCAFWVEFSQNSICFFKVLWPEISLQKLDFFLFFLFFLFEWKDLYSHEGGLEADDPWGQGCCSSPVLRTPVNPLESDRSVSDPLDSAGLVLTFNPSGLEMDHFSVKLLLVLKLRCYREKNWNWRLLMTVPASSVCTERLSKA